MEDSRKAVIYALIACVIWGTVYVAIKTGINHGMRPLTFAGVRFLTGGLLLIGFAALRGTLRLSARDLAVLALLGFFQTGVQNALFFKGVELTGAGVSAIFINTAPFFVIAASPFFFRESRITPMRVAGALAGFAGVLLTSYRPGATRPGFEAGVLCLVLSAMTWAGSNIAAKKLMLSRDTVTVTGVQMAAGALPLLASGILVEGNGLAGADGAAWAVLGYLVLFATSIPFLAWYRALELGELGRVSVFNFTLPVMGVISGWLVLGEAMDAHIALGMALVAAGIVAVNRS